MSERSLLASAYAVTRTLGASIKVVWDSAFDRLTPEIADGRILRWSHDVLDRANVTVELVNGEHLADHKTCIVMSNHGSLFDVPIIFSVFPGRLRMIGKAELFALPLLGKALLATGFVPVSRSGSKEEAIAAMSEAKAALANGTSIWLAPEGTRSDDGSLHAFKKGGFHLAKSAGVPIFPITIVDSHHILPKHSQLVHRGVHVKLVCGAPIDPADKSIDDLMAAVRAHLKAAS
jgi:1-acyl-sn-glycerol-3-phosphate acyltransferase